MALKPLKDRVVIKPVEAEERTSSGIVLPESAKEKPLAGEVVAVGEGKYDEAGNRIALDVKVGDRVIYGQYGGQKVKVLDEEYLVLREDDILAIVE